MIKSIAASLSLLALVASVQAAPSIQLTPSFESVSVGDEFNVLVKGLGFGTTDTGLTIVNFTGGQNLNFTFQSSMLEVLSVTIDPRWTFAAGNKPGTIDNVNGTLKGVAFGVTPPTTDDDFNIASIKVRAIGAGQGTLDLTTGTFVGLVTKATGGNSTQAIAAAMGQADVTITSAVPEPQTWALLLAGMGCISLKLRRRG